MARLDPTWENFRRRGQTWDHIWQDGGSTTCFNEAILASSPAAYWRFDEASGNFIDKIGSVTANASGSGIGYGASGLTGDGNSAISFSGTQSVNCSNGPNVWTGTDWTHESLVKFTNSASGYEGIASSGTYLTDGFRLGRQNDGVIRFWTTENGGTITLNGPAASAGTTYHTAVTKTGSTFELWVNGVSYGTSSGTFVAATGTSAGQFGALNNSNGLVGTIDEGAFYSTALSRARIQAHYVAILNDCPPAPPAGGNDFYPYIGAGYYGAA